MSVTRGPGTPASGWERRWPRQAAGLLLAHPEVSVVFLLALCTGGGVIFAADTLFTYNAAGYLVFIAVQSFAGALIVITTIASLVAAEGYPLDTGPKVRRGIWVYCALIAFCMTVVVALASIAFLAIVLLADIPLGSTPPGAGAAVAARVAADVVFALSGALMIAGVAGVTIPFTMICAGDSLREAHVNTVLHHLKHRRSATALKLITLFVAFWLDTLPIIAAVAGALFLITWIYVGVREIFGGIDANRRAASARDARALPAGQEG